MKTALVILVAAFSASMSACERPTSPGDRTFLFGGVVRNSSSSPVAGATIYVVSGSLAGRSTTSDALGQFQFDQPASALEPTTLMVLAAGYAPVTVQVDRATVVVTLTAPAKFPIEGDYTVTFTAASECTMLPSHVRQRSYAATIAVSRRLASSLDANFAVELNGSDFFAQLRTLSLAIRGNIATFFINSVEAEERWIDDLPLYERLGTTEYVSLHGKGPAALSITATAFATTFDGTVAYCPRFGGPIGPGYPPSCLASAIECRSDRHQIAGTQR